ncbi:DUF3800 domain-containing protein [Corynebacterium aquatimens]
MGPSTTDCQPNYPRYPIPAHPVPDTRPTGTKNRTRSRVNSYALNNGDTAKCYLDDHYTAPEGRKEFVEYKATGEFGYRSSKLASIDELEFYDSKEKRGLQAADLCCYIYQRRMHVKAGNEKMLKTQEKMWGAISDIILRGRQRVWP